MNLIEAIDQYKKSQGIKTDIELAEKLGITADYISKLRQGRRQPGNLVWKAIVNDAPPLIPHMLLYFQRELADFNAMKGASRIR